MERIGREAYPSYIVLKVILKSCSPVPYEDVRICRESFTAAESCSSPNMLR